MACRTQNVRCLVITQRERSVRTVVPLQTENDLLILGVLKEDIPRRSELNQRAVQSNTFRMQDSVFVGLSEQKHSLEDR